MQKRWLLLITRDMRLYMPPELYLGRAQADFEARRWLWFMFGIRRISGDRLRGGEIRVGVRHMLHLVELELPEPRDVTDLWACLATDQDAFPEMTVDVIAGTVEDGRAWVLRHASKSEEPSEAFGAEWCYEMTFHRRGVLHYCAAHRVK
jgi:hypothetical protein